MKKKITLKQKLNSDKAEKNVPVLKNSKSKRVNGVRVFSESSWVEVKNLTKEHFFYAYLRLLKNTTH